MHAKLVRVLSRVDDPFLNMALERRLYETLPRDAAVLLCWINRDSIVLGRFQNPWAECDTVLAKRDGIPIVRRISGGGTVFHDKGNLNFSVITSRACYDQTRSFAVVLGALERLGLKPEVRNKSDIVLSEKKISGNAFKVGSDKALHHGTLLLRSDLPRLKAYLKPAVQPASSKAIKSRPSQVMNISESLPNAALSDLAGALRQSFLETYGPAETEDLVFGDREALTQKDLGRIAGGFREWAWVYGKTPEFTAAMDGMTITVEKGVMTDITDSKGAPALPDLLRLPFDPELFKNR